MFYNLNRLFCILFLNKIETLGVWSTSQPNGLVVPEASLHAVNSTTDVLDLMQIGQSNRAVGSTALNERSSRSHRYFTIYLTDRDFNNLKCHLLPFGDCIGWTSYGICILWSYFQFFAVIMGFMLEFDFELEAFDIQEIQDDKPLRLVLDTYTLKFSTGTCHLLLFPRGHDQWN